MDKKLRNKRCYLRLYLSFAIIIPLSYWLKMQFVLRLLFLVIGIGEDIVLEILTRQIEIDQCLWVLQRWLCSHQYSRWRNAP